MYNIDHDREFQQPKGGGGGGIANVAKALLICDITHFAQISTKITEFWQIDDVLVYNTKAQNRGSFNILQRV